MLFQGAALFDSMSVGENVLLPLQEHADIDLPAMLARVEEVLIMVGLPGIQHKSPSGLSTSEKKRVGLARALANWPKILLYDEPTTGMDPLVSEMIDGLIVRVGKEEKDLTSVVVSHDMKAALTTGDFIDFLYLGKIERSGTPADFHASEDAFVRQFFAGRVEGPMSFL